MVHVNSGLFIGNDTVCITFKHDPYLHVCFVSYVVDTTLIMLIHESLKTCSLYNVNGTYLYMEINASYI